MTWTRGGEIQGERGTLAFDSVPQPTTATLTLLGCDGVRHDFPGPQNNMVHEVQRFAELVTEGGDASADHGRTLAMLRVLEALANEGPSGQT